MTKFDYYLNRLTKQIWMQNNVGTINTGHYISLLCYYIHHTVVTGMNLLHGYPAVTLYVY